MAGLYIHIPFCESRCIYCGFYSTTSLQRRDAYVDALCKEMELRPLTEAIGDKNSIDTIYLGGGTPSQLTGEQLQRIFQAIAKFYTPHFENMEITMECNPDDVTPSFCNTLRQLPINRISMGAQTFSDERLRFLHRRHQAKEVCQAVENLRAIGIHNISIDLMFGFPNETLTEWEKDIYEALDLGVEHISAYSLMYEEGTVLYRLLEQRKIQEVDEEVSLQMYETLCEILKKAGYEHYEISNFARPGFRSKHNSNYWKEVPYIGLGAAAHSYKRSPKEITRSWNIDDIQTYIQTIHAGELPSEGETLDLKTRYNDLITTALRTKEGINLDQMEKEFGSDYVDRLLKEAKDKIQRGVMKRTHNENTLENHENSKCLGHLSLTSQGIYISDDIMGDFMIVD